MKMQTKTLLAPALVAPALLVLAGPAAELSFHPAEGATVTMTFGHTSEISLEDMSIISNGQEIDPSMMGDVEMNISSTQSITVTDEYVTIEGSRPTKLKRSYDSLSNATSTSMSNPMIGDTETDVESASELEGMTIVFTWNEDEGAYEAAFEDGEGDPELLDGLEADLTLRGFLPDGDVSEGDSWEVDPQNMRTVLAPGGALKLEPTEELDLMSGGGPQPDASEFLRNIDGTVTATLKGTRDVEGIRVAVISLEFELLATADLTETMAEAMEGQDMGQEGMDMSFDAFDIEFAYQGEGELHWNLQAGVVDSCQVSGEVELIIEQAMNISMPGMGEMTMEQTMTMAGTQSANVASGE